MTANEVREWEQRHQQVSHKVYFTSDPEVDEQCILIVDGDTMSVRSVSHQDASVGLSVVWRVMVQLEPSPI